jgi:fumarylpyruvate hydrolase
MFTIEQPTLAVAGWAERFPIRRVYCVARNYADHAREMGADPQRESPFYFAKPADALFTADEGYQGGPPAVVPYPPHTSNLHHEVELVIAIGMGGTDIPAATSMRHVWGYAVGLDLTRRDLQDTAKAARRPWDLAKGFDGSGPVSQIARAHTVDPSTGRIWLSVDGDVRQDGDLAQQTWPVSDIISDLSSTIALRPGDLIMTGTPAGVGPLQRGQVVEAGIDGMGRLSFTVS